jgi:hypothetical protein
MIDAISIQRRDFVRAQYGIVTTLLFLAFLLYIYQGFRGVDLFVRAFGVFDVEQEDSLTTWFSSFNLMLSACFLFAIFAASRAKLEGGNRYWLFLGLIFLALSIDEVAGFHERSARLTQLMVLVFTGEVASEAFQGSYRVLFENWILPGVIISIVIFLFFLPFLRRLPKRTAVLFLFAGGVYVGGALGFEAVGDWMNYKDIAQYGDLLFNIRQLFEEGGEMFGIAIFNCTLFNELTKENRTLTIYIGTSP